MRGPPSSVSPPPRRSTRSSRPSGSSCSRWVRRRRSRSSSRSSRCCSSPFAYRELNSDDPRLRHHVHLGARRRSARGWAGWAAGASPWPAWSCSPTSPRSRGIYFWALRRHRAHAEDALWPTTSRSSPRRASSSSPLMTLGELARASRSASGSRTCCSASSTSRWRSSSSPRCGSSSPGTAPDRDAVRLAVVQPVRLHRLARASSRRSCSPCSSTGAGTPASRSTRRRRTPSASRAARPCSRPSILLVTYVGVTVAAMTYAGLGETGTGLGNEANADDFFLAIKDGLLGPVGWLLVVAVHDLGDLVDADDDPADRPRHARRWPPTRRCRGGSRRCTRGTRRRRSRPW